MDRSHDGETGWSPPYLLILLVLIIAVAMLFFGTLRWIGLCILCLFALLVAFVTLNTILHKEAEQRPRKRRRAGKRPAEPPREEIPHEGSPGKEAPCKSDFFAHGVDGDLKYVDCAVATDGGSLALVLSDDLARSFSLVLDRALGTKTYDRIRYQGKELLSYEEEMALLPKLHMLAHGDKDVGKDIIETFIGVIETRS